MVRKILHNQHASRFAFDFHPLADALERAERLLDGLALNAAPVRQSCCRQSVQHIMSSGQGHSYAGYFTSAKNHAKFRGGALPQDVARLPVTTGRESKCFHGTKSFRTDVSKLGALAPNQYASAPRHQVDQPAKLQRDCG